MSLTNRVTSRIVYIDHIRLMIIMLVVIAHANMTYSSIGSWYYMENDVVNMTDLELIFFGLLNALTAAFTMGFLFLLAGYFIPVAYDHKGFLIFLKSRFTRLGIPVVIYVFIIDPFTRYIILSNHYNRGGTFSSKYKKLILSLEFLDDTGPLWFAFSLLVFSIIYALFRVLRLRLYSVSILSKLSPNFTIIYLIIVVSFITYIVRLTYPIGTHFYNFQFSFFTQYIVLFIVGIIVRRLNLLNRITFKFGMKWFLLGLMLSAILFSGTAYFGGAIENPYILLGGNTIQAALYALWESITCASMILGLIVLFRRWVNTTNNFTRMLSQNAFGVYVLHAPVLVFLSTQFSEVKASPLVKIIILSITGLISTFIVSYIIRKIKPFGKILS